MASASVVFDVLARDNASDKFGKIAKSADNTGSKMAKFGKLAKVGMAALGGGALAAGVGLFKLTQMAADDETSQKRLAKTLQNTTGATKAQIAGVEDWISAQGRALGVADDDLRPALDKLAVATGDVGQAQRLASLAMDVSAGTGKNLQTVATALAKAQGGNVGALGRLGIATKDANGHTKSFAQLQDDLSKKFKGQAKTSAETFAGKMGRLKLALSEAGESIGYKLLPIATKLADWVTTKGLPAMGKFGDWFDKNGSPVLKKFGDALDKVGGVLSKVFGWMADNKETVATFAGVIGTVTVGVGLWTAAQTALNVVLAANPLGLVVVALAGVAAGLVYAFKHSQKFRTIVQGAFTVVKRAGELMAEGIKRAVGIMTKLFLNFTGPGLIIKHFDKIVGFVRALPGRIKTAAGDLFHSLKEKASAARDWVRDRVGEIPGKLADKAGKFKEAGKTLINKFIDGLKSVGGFAGSLASGVYTALKSKINDLISGLNSAIPNSIGKGPLSINLPDNPVPFLARGVRNFAGGLAVVGERGPELVGLPAGADVYSNAQSRAMIGAVTGGGGGRSRAADDARLAKLIEEAMTKALESAHLGLEVRGDHLELVINRNRTKLGKPRLA